MGKKMITGSTELPGVGRVRWTAVENSYANGTVWATVLQDSRGPHGALSNDERDLLVRYERRLSA